MNIEGALNYHLPGELAFNMPVEFPAPFSFVSMNLYVTVQYEINVADDIDIPNIDIPPMLIQPYVENAIWHGLIPLKNKKGK